MRTWEVLFIIYFYFVSILQLNWFVQEPLLVFENSSTGRNLMYIFDIEKECHPAATQWSQNLDVQLYRGKRFERFQVNLHQFVLRKWWLHLYPYFSQKIKRATTFILWVFCRKTIISSGLIKRQQRHYMAVKTTHLF